MDCLEKALSVVKEMAMENEKLQKQNNELEQQLDEIKHLKDKYEHLLCLFKYLIKQNGGEVKIPELAYLEPTKKLYMTYDPIDMVYIYEVR